MYSCPECEQKFSRSSNLRTHMLIHKSDRLVYVCPKEGCGRFYCSNRNMKKHIQSYHEERPFNCTYGKCYRAFKSQEELEAHRAIHSPSRRLKKKKKKSKTSFAAELAGLAKKKWQSDLLKSESKSADVELSSEDEPMELQLNVAKTNETSASSEVKDCDKRPVSDDGNNTALHLSKDGDSDCVQNDNIQKLLNTVEKRNCFESESIPQETKCISVET